MFYLSIALATLSSLLYHIFQKLTPTNVNFALTFTVTYTTAAVICGVLYLFFRGDDGLLVSLRRLNWASFAVALTIVGLEIGFLLVYRAGWNISVAALLANTVVSILLIPIGLMFFQEKLTLVNVIGMVVCLAGLVMINLK